MAQPPQQRSASAGGQRPASGGAPQVAKSQMPSGYEDVKSQFEKRATQESKKIRELFNAVEKGRAQLEAERKAYCEDLKKHLIAYAADEHSLTPSYVTQVQGLVKRLDKLNQAYLQAIQHIQEVAQPGLGYLPKRFDALKKQIKVAQQVPTEVAKIRDFEYERIENLKFAMLHFFNAKMYLHAKALELFSESYETMRQISIKQEFRTSDPMSLQQVLREHQNIPPTPRGGGGSNSARSNEAGNSARGQSPATQAQQMQRSQQQQQQQQQRPSSQEQQRQMALRQQQQLQQQQRQQQQQQRR